MTWRSLRHSNPPTGTIKPVGDSGHKCGKCSWQGKGREDCPNNKTRAQQWAEAIEARRASQEMPYLPPSAWVNVPEPDYPESPHGPL